jgi:hypothetical protein
VEENARVVSLKVHEVIVNPPNKNLFPAVIRAKHAAPALNVKRPVAPPVYRPQTKPVVAQAKMAGPVKAHPIAPPAYRPQAAPKVLQRKIASGQGPRAVEPARSPAAPPIYRPDFRPKPLQTPGVKPSLSATSFKHAKPVVQAKQAAPQLARVSPAVRIQPPIAQTPRPMHFTRTPIGGPSGAVVQRSKRELAALMAAAEDEEEDSDDLGKGKRAKKELKEDQGNLQFLINAYKTPPNWSQMDPVDGSDDEEEEEEDAKGEGECAATVYLKGKAKQEVAGNYSSKSGNHAEMSALAKLFAAGKKVKDIKKIEISSPPCKKCKAILIVLGLADKVWVPWGKGKSHGSCKAFAVPMGVLAEVATKLKTSPDVIHTYLQKAP